MKRIFSVIFCIIITISSISLISYAQNESEKVTVNAKAYALMDVSQKKVLLGKNEHERLYPASVTKIMTLLLVIESIDNGKCYSQYCCGRKGRFTNLAQRRRNNDC